MNERERLASFVLTCPDDEFFHLMMARSFKEGEKKGTVVRNKTKSPPITIVFVGVFIGFALPTLALALLIYILSAQA